VGATSLFAGNGGFFQNTPTNNALTNGEQGMWQMTATRAGFVNLRNASGTEVGIAATPIQVSLANTATNATAIKVDGSAVTQPISGTVTTSPPSNASTNIAEINGIAPLMGNGVTGTGSQRVTVASDNTAFSVNAIQSGTWTVNPTTAANWGIHTLGSTTSGTSGVLSMGATTTAAPSYTTAQTNALSLTTAGALRVDNSAVTQPVSGTVTTTPPSNASTNIAEINGITPLMGNGVTGTGSQRVTISSDNTAFSVNAIQSGTWNIGSITTLPALPANQSVNVAQENGVTPSMGNGVSGTGVRRVAIASDNTAFSVNANAGTNLNTSALALSATQGTTADAPATVPTTTTAATEIALLKVIANLANSPTALSSQYPTTANGAAVPITISATGTTGATTATLAAAVSKTTFICGFTITSDATAAIAGTATVTGTVTGTLNYIQNVGTATSAGTLTQAFAPCIPASATNTGIAVNSVAAGVGGNTAVTAWGYQLP
jgi:hypothetical protein